MVGEEIVTICTPLFFTGVFIAALYIYIVFVKNVKKYFGIFRLFAKRYNFEIKKDEKHIYKWPKISGTYDNKEIVIRTIKDEKYKNLTAIFIEVKIKQKNIIWFFIKKILENNDLAKLLDSFSIKNIDNNFKIGCNDSQMTINILNNKKIMKILEKLNNDKNIHSIILTNKYLKFYTQYCIPDLNVLIEKFKLLLKLTKELEIELENNIKKEDQKVLPIEKGLNKNTEIIFSMSRSISMPKSGYGTEFIAFGFIFFLIAVIPLFFYLPEGGIDFDLFIVSSIFGYISLLCFLYGIIVNYHWRKYGINLFY